MGEKMIKIDIWSDFVCPFCYIGRKKLEEALGELGLSEKVEKHYRSFELDRSKERKNGGDVVYQLATQYSMPMGKAERVMEKTADKVEAEGLVYNYKKAISANTFNAHRLNYYAKEFGKDEEMTSRILEAHFVHGLDIANIEVLATLGQEIGLDKTQISAMFESDQYDTEIQNDKKMAIELKIELVPTYIINDQYRIEGILSSEDYLEFLNQVIEK